MKEKHIRWDSMDLQRDMDFSLLKKGESEIWFRLVSDEETLSKYPFPFVLDVGYRLERIMRSVCCGR